MARPKKVTPASTISEDPIKAVSIIKQKSGFWIYREYVLEGDKVVSTSDSHELTRPEALEKYKIGSVKNFWD